MIKNPGKNTNQARLKRIETWSWKNFFQNMTNKYCVWIGCKSSSKKDKNGQKFNGRWACFVKPSVNKPRALQWIRIMNRADFGLKNIKKHTFLCDKHFPAEGDIDLQWWTNSNLTPIPTNYRGHRVHPIPENEKFLTIQGFLLLTTLKVLTHLPSIYL